jgi:hypothetical protein
MEIRIAPMKNLKKLVTIEFMSVVVVTSLPKNELNVKKNPDARIIIMPN